MPKFVFLFVFVTVLGFACPPESFADEIAYSVDFSKLSAAELESELARIDHELATLARFSVRSEVGAIGHRSKPRESAEANEWIQIDLDKTYPIDEIILVPTLWRDKDLGFQADGMPVVFKVLVGSENDKSGREVASFSQSDNLLPRLAPVVVHCKDTEASWVRIEATRLSPRGYDGKYIFQLGEVLAFSGNENIALNQNVSTSSRSWVAGGARSDRFMVDGDVPYLMNTGAGIQSLPFIGDSTPDKLSELTIDLGKSMPVNRVQLYGIDLSDTAPRSTPADFGVSPHLIVEGANNEDFSDAKTLFEYRVESIYDVSPLVVRRFKETECRFVRFRVVEPYVEAINGREKTRIGFSEIEVYSRGDNVSFTKSVTARNTRVHSNRPLELLTDGNNLYGRILPVRKWLKQLARRHELENSRPALQTELNRRFAFQKWLVWALSLLAVLLVAGIGMTWYVSKRIRVQKVASLRKKFAADLHDELGANLYSIGLLSDLARQSKLPDEKLEDIHRRIRGIVDRSGGAIRYWADMEKNDKFCADLAEDMERAAERIVVHLEHDLQIEGTEHLERLNSETRAGILLFYKECLVNICRHSEATELSTSMKVTERELRLAVKDNGRGFDGTGDCAIPSSLSRRAQLLKAEVACDTPAEGGTEIHLALPIRRRNTR